MNDEKFYKERLLSNDNYKVFLPDLPNVRRSEINKNGFNNKNLIKVLKEDYIEIYNSIQEESYYIPDNEQFFYLYEIFDEDDEKIVGFASLYIYRKDALVLNQIYVLPEYRGQKHFVKVYNYFKQQLDEVEIYVKNPNRTIINNIKDLNYCEIIKDRFLISYILFIAEHPPFEDSLKYTNKTINDVRKSSFYEGESNLYDLQLDAVIKLSSNNKEYQGYENLQKVERSTLSLVRQEDELKYDILSRRNSDPWIKHGNYFKKVTKIFKKESIKITREY
ncbi:MAG: GNAT family N-acetyltransferase [Methanosphaera sp.]|nr:GNAT family N-acetyltransferase [Methanosphaera sp.]